MKITYDGLVINDIFPVPDADGLTWLTQTLTGWESMPSRMGSMDYTMRHGGVIANPTYGPKAINVGGVCKSPSEDKFWLGYNRLLGIASTLKVGREFVVTEDVEKTLTVVRGGEPRFRIHPGHFEWELSLTAMDPLKYGPPVTTTIAVGATKNVINTGNIESPRITVTATGTGRLGLRNNKTGFRVHSSVAMTSGTVIDQRARTAYLGTENRYYQLASTSLWWALEPGLNPIVNDGEAPVSITYRPAWA